MRWRKGENRDGEPVIRGIQRPRHRHHNCKYDREGMKGGRGEKKRERKRWRRKREMKREARMRKEGRDTEERKPAPRAASGSHSIYSCSLA